MICDLFTAFDELMCCNQVSKFFRSEEIFRLSSSKPIYEMDLQTIHQRTSFSYYRRSAQIKFDLNVIENNIKEYSETNDSVLVLHDFKKLKRVLFEFMDTEYWSRDPIMTFFEKEFQQTSHYDSDSDFDGNFEIECIPVRLFDLFCLFHRFILFSDRKANQFSQN